MKRLEDQTNFGFRYLLAGLLSRGSIIKDQMLKSNASRDEFLVTLLENYDKDKRVMIIYNSRLI